MIYGINSISSQSFVTDIVKEDYRTAAIFRKYGIEFCCGVRLPLEMACSTRGLNPVTIQAELEKVARTINVSNALKFDEWDLCFLCDYIIHIHHEYVKLAMPDALASLRQFAEGHRKKYSYLDELTDVFSGLVKEMLAHIVQEEEIIFPYIRRITHAYNSKESYAALLVRTLGKPVKDVMEHEHEFTLRSLHKIRELTANYTTPPDACTNHKVNFLTLREIDNDIVQHLHLENNILFPKAIEMEKELLQKNDSAQVISKIDTLNY